jgi:hypothetical protein
MNSMNRTIYLIAVFVGLTAGISCKKVEAPATPSTTAELRIFNSTPWTVYDCTVDPAGTLSDNPGPNAYNFGQADINAKTDYKIFPWLYRYSWVRLTMNNKTYYLKPYDYRGESLLASGRYSYKLTYVSANDRLNLELIKD